MAVSIGAVVVYDEDALRKEIERIAEEAGAESVAVSFYDYESETAGSYHGDQWFHAASTIKIAVLAALFAAVDEKKFHPKARLHIRNRFISIADGRPYRVAANRETESVSDAFDRNVVVGRPDPARCENVVVARGERRDLAADERDLILDGRDFSHFDPEAG